MNPQKTLQQLDEIIQDTLKNLDSAVIFRNRRIYESILVLSGKLNTRRNSTIVASAENLKVVEAIKREMAVLIDDSPYAMMAMGVSKDFDSLIAVLDGYFASVVDGYQQNAELAKAIRAANLATTIESLLGSGIDANFTEPLTKLLRQNVAGNATIKNMTDALRVELLGNADTLPRLNRYVGQVAADALQQFERNYVSAVSFDLKLEYFLFLGTSIDDTRPFCRSRVGKAFTKTEVDSWNRLDWTGKIPGVDVRIGLGGYRCRHRLLPVSKEVHEKLK